MNQPLNRVPIIRVWSLLLVPVQGELSDSQAEQLRHEVLSEIHTGGSVGLILDVTGLWLMDSHLVSVLTSLARSASLMGTDTVVCGINADTAMTIQSMGLELRGVRTTMTLETALETFGVGRPHTETAAAHDDLLGAIT